MTMTIDEAIRLIQEDIGDEDVDWNSPLGEAYKLSFEALKVLSKRPFDWDDDNPFRLPGETK